MKNVWESVRFSDLSTLHLILVVSKMKIKMVDENWYFLLQVKYTFANHFVVIQIEYARSKCSDI